MCYAGNCHPECDNCKPKYLVCPDCGSRTFIARPKCLMCGHAITEGEREAAREDWRVRHPYSNEANGSTRWE